MKRILLVRPLTLFAILVLTACATQAAATTPTTAPTTAPAATRTTPPVEAAAAANNNDSSVGAASSSAAASTEKPQAEAQTTADAEAQATQETQMETVADADEQPVVVSQTPTELCAAAGVGVEPTNREYAQPQQVLQPNIDYRAIFCTDAGAIYIDLLEQYAPITVNSFVFLAQNDYYNNTIFHRVIQDFMAQGGDPTGTGRGGPGYQFRDEFVGFLTFDTPGWLAMANAGAGTNGSQFFITTVPTEHLNYKHTIFGEVLEGQENVRNIQLRDPSQIDSPATKILNVLVITDPSTVKTTYTASADAEPAQVIASLTTMKGVMPADLVTTTSEAPLSLEVAVATAPEAMRADYRTFLEKYNYQFGAVSLIDNQACNLNSYSFFSLGYRLDGFATAADASAALVDGFLNELALAQGYMDTEQTVLGGSLYTLTQQTCNQQASAGRVYVQRGRYIATIEAVIPVNPQYGVDAIIDQFAARFHELNLTDVLRRELRES